MTYTPTKGEEATASRQGRHCPANGPYGGSRAEPQESGVSGHPGPRKLCQIFEIQVFNVWAGPASWVPSLGTSWQARLVADCRPASPDLTDVLQPYALFLVFSSFVSRGWAASTLWLADWLGSLRPAMSHPCFRTRSLIGPRHSGGGGGLTAFVPTTEDSEGRGR